MDNGKLNQYLERINNLMWNTFMVKDRYWGRNEGKMIMDILEEWANDSVALAMKPEPSGDSLEAVYDELCKVMATPGEYALLNRLWREIHDLRTRLASMNGRLEFYDRDAMVLALDEIRCEYRDGCMSEWMAEAMADWFIKSYIRPVHHEQRGSEPVCHCGNLMKDHDQTSDHMAVEMEKPEPRGGNGDCETWLAEDAALIEEIYRHIHYNRDVLSARYALSKWALNRYHKDSLLASSQWVKGLANYLTSSGEIEKLFRYLGTCAEDGVGNADLSPEDCFLVWSIMRDWLNDRDKMQGANLESHPQPVGLREAVNKILSEMETVGRPNKLEWSITKTALRAALAQADREARG